MNVVLSLVAVRCAIRALEASRHLANPVHFCCRREYRPWDIARSDVSQSLAAGGNRVERGGYHVFYRFHRISKSSLTDQTTTMIL